MFDYKAAFMRYLDEKGIKYTDVDENRVRVGYNGDNIPSVQVSVIFDKDGDGLVAFRSWNLGKVKDEKFANILLACNQLNDQFRWVKFYIDSDQDITAALDAVVDEQTVGEECFQLVIRMVSICDDAYPTIMQAMWG